MVGLYMGQDMAMGTELKKVDLAAWRWGLPMCEYK